MFIQELGHMVGGSKVNIKPESVVYSIIRRPRIIYEIIKIIQFIIIIILLCYFILYEIQQLISNIDSWMEYMTFCAQPLKCYTIMPCGMGYSEIILNMVRWP